LYVRFYERKQTLRRLSTIRSPFASWFIVSNFSSVLTVCRRYLNGIALDDIDLGFSFVLVTTANAVGGGNYMSRMFISPT